MTDLGVLKGDANIEITYDKVRVLGSKAEVLKDFIKNMAANASFELYQLHLPNIEKLLEGAAEVINTPGTLQEDVEQQIAVGIWLYDKFVPFENQNGAGTKPTVNLVTASLDTELTLTLTSVLAGDKVTINGLVFTAHADTTTPANREFDISGTDSQDATELATCINHATYGVPGLTATPAAEVVTLTVDTPLVTGLSAYASSATIAIDGELELDTDYFVMKDQDGIWGIYIIDSATITTESQIITLLTDYTPAASKTLKMGTKSAELTPKIVEFSKTINGKIFRARLWAATNEEGLTFAFPDSAGEEPASIPVVRKGGLDSSKAEGEQLIEIYDEIGLTM